MNEADALKALDAYFQLMSMKGGSEVFRAARQSGVLPAVAGGAATADAVAARCGLDVKATSLLLECLCAMSLVVRTADQYEPAPVLQFLSGTYQDLGSQYWDHLPQFLASGQPMQRMDDPAVGMKVYAEQASALYWMMLPSAVTAARMLGIGKERKNLNILDIGAGSGVWSLTFAQHDPGARVTAIDWPGVLQIATGVAQKSGLLGRFTACPGDYRTVGIGAATYDLAVAGNVAHLERESGLRSLFHRLHAALKPGGCLVVVDVFHGQTGGELNAALYELGLALRTEKGRVHGRATLEACLRDSGFGAIAYQAIPAIPHTMGLMVAQKGA